MEVAAFEPRNRAGGPPVSGDHFVFNRMRQGAISEFAIIFAMFVFASSVAAFPSAAQQQCAHRHATFEYTDKLEGVTFASVSPTQQRQFEKAFCDEAMSVENWFIQQHWWKLAPGHPNGFVSLPETYQTHRGTFDAPFPDLHVLVSSEYSLSESLVPAFLGHRGTMQFPATRVAEGEAAIAHELAHVFFPNSNRMLAEGFAVYVQWKIGSSKAYPNFGDDLDNMVTNFACRLRFNNLDSIDIEALDKGTTPSVLSLRVGQKLYLTDDTYVVAGSFVKFLIESPLGIDKFHSLYSYTPLVPFERDAGARGRWNEVYGVSLVDLQNKWKAQFPALNCPH
jgi:hypothetical protein